MARKIPANSKHKGAARPQPTHKGEPHDDSTEQEQRTDSARKQVLDPVVNGLLPNRHISEDSPENGYTPPPGYLFELCFLGFLITHLVLQNCIVHGMHVEKYNLNYITFCAILFTKRVSWKFVHTAWCKSQRITISVAFRILISMIPTAALLVTVRELISQHDNYTLSLLVYPYILYFALFGVTGTSDSVLGFQPATLQQQHQAQQQSQHTETLQHTETTPWVLVYFRQHLKHIVYASVEAGYYATFLPVVFLLDLDAIYDQRLTVITAAHCIINTAVLLLANIVASGSRDFYVQAKRIGCWSEVRRNTGAPTWTRKDWPQGAQVRHRKKTYASQGQTNVMEPDNWISWLFYQTFHNPTHTATLLVYVQIAVVGMQLVFLLIIRKWEVVAAWCALMLASYLAIWYVLGVRRNVLCSR